MIVLGHGEAAARPPVSRRSGSATCWAATAASCRCFSNRLGGRSGHRDAPGYAPILHAHPGGGTASCFMPRRSGRAAACIVLDMGEQIRMVDMARNLIRQAGLVPETDVKIVFTGLRPGEKIAEELVSGNEQLQPSDIASVSRVRRSPPVKDLAQLVKALEEMAVAGQADRVVAALRSLAAAGVPHLEKVVLEEETSVLAAGEARIPCPNCKVGAISRSRARRPAERLRKRLTAQRLYRCDRCGWRGWHQHSEPLGSTRLQQQSPPDLSALDAGTSNLSHSPVPTTAGLTRRRGFSPRDL